MADGQPVGVLREGLRTSTGCIHAILPGPVEGPRIDRVIEAKARAAARNISGQALGVDADAQGLP